MNRHEANSQLPGNRPSGLPGNARFAGGAVLALMFIVINLAADYSVYTNNPTDYFGSLTPVFFPMVFLCVGLAFLLNTGKLIFVKLYRKLAVGVTAAYIGSILLNAGMVLLYGWDRTFPAVLGVGLLLLVSPMLFLMWRDFRRSRWLDPNSLPSEWEIAAIRDPKSINYRPPKVKKRK